MRLNILSLLPYGQKIYIQDYKPLLAYEQVCVIKFIFELFSNPVSGGVSINGPTFFGEVSASHVGLGYAKHLHLVLLTTNYKYLTSYIYRGATGYGRFDIEHFTVKRMQVIHPPNQKYALVD